eukprot:6205481-Pleurochrysis_carterae.AAC.1
MPGLSPSEQEEEYRYQLEDLERNGAKLSENLKDMMTYTINYDPKNDGMVKLSESWATKKAQKTGGGGCVLQ